MMLPRCVQRFCRFLPRLAPPTCGQYDTVANTCRALSPSMQVIAGHVLQPLISLKTGQRNLGTSSNVHQKCWQCGCQLEASSIFFCPKCKTILPPPAAQADLFEVMGLLEATYEINLRQLEVSYKRLQKELHPDKFGSRGARQQEYSAEQSSLVNRAYTVLKSPLSRALYLLERKGVPVPEDGGTISDPDLLMEVMEQRERIEETDDPAVLQTMLQENKLLQQATTERLSEAFMKSNLEAAERAITDLRYVTRTGEAVAKKIPGG